MKSMSRKDFFKLMRKHPDLCLKGEFTKHWKAVLKELSYLARIEEILLFITKDSVRFFVAVNKPSPTDNWFPHLNRGGTSLSFMTYNVGKYLADKSSKARYVLEGVSQVKCDGYDVFELRRSTNSPLLTKLKPNHRKDETALFSTENHRWYGEQKKILENLVWRQVPFTPTESQRRMYAEQPKFTSWQNDAESFITKDALAGFGLNNPYSRATPRGEASSMKSEKPLTSNTLIEALGTLQALTHDIPKDPVDDVFDWASLVAWINAYSFNEESARNGTLEPIGFLQGMANTPAAAKVAILEHTPRYQYLTENNPDLLTTITDCLNKPKDDS